MNDDIFPGLILLLYRFRVEYRNRTKLGRKNWDSRGSCGKIKNRIGDWEIGGWGNWHWVSSNAQRTRFEGNLILIFNYTPFAFFAYFFASVFFGFLIFAIFWIFSKFLKLNMKQKATGVCQKLKKTLETIFTENCRNWAFHWGLEKNWSNL